MEGSIANKGESENCRDLAKEFIKKGEYAKAAKFFDKSLRLFPLPGVQALKEKAEQLASGGGARSSSSESPRPQRQGSQDSNSGRESPMPSSESSSQRAYTPDQESGSKKILAAAKKSHYEVLGIAKTATGDEIKKAYRKLALKFHPDKNSAPSAEGAFKAISTAFDCLSDSSKRDLYDQYGHEADTNNAGGGGGGFRGGFPGGAHMNMNEVNPEDLFNFLFQNSGPGFRGGQFGRGGFRTYNFHTGGRHDERHERQRQQPQQPASLFQQLLQFLPVILMLLMSFSSFNSNSSQPLYSFKQRGIYQVPKMTSARGVIPDIKYFVSDQFTQQYKSTSTDTFKRFEKELETEYKMYLAEKCREEKSNKEHRKYQARFGGKEARAKAELIPLPSCDEFQKKFINKFGQ